MSPYDGRPYLFMLTVGPPILLRMHSCFLPKEIRAMASRWSKLVRSLFAIGLRAH